MTTTLTHPADGVNSVRPHSKTKAVTTGSSPGTRTYTYDSAGHLTARPGVTGVQQNYTWDGDGDLSQISQSSSVDAKMVYDSAGNRLVRQQGTTTTIYVGGAELSQTGSTLSAIRYYTHHSQTVAMRTSNAASGVSTVIPDLLGTPHVQLSQSTGAYTIRWQDPYGQVRGYTGTSWVGEKGLAGGTINNTGTTRIGARDHDPLLGFITIDPKPQAGVNPYTYSNNSPVTYSDPTGERLTRCDGPCDPAWDVAAPTPKPTPTPTPKPTPTPTPPPPPAKAPSSTGHTAYIPIPKTCTGWCQAWDAIPKNPLNLGLTYVAGKVAMQDMLARPGGQCYFESNYGINVCWGANSPLAARGGTMIGNTFVAQFKDSSLTLVDPRSRNDYASRIEHEYTHAAQWQAVGVGMLLYFINELPVKGADAVRSLAGLSPLPMGCFNFFEITAGLKKGGYQC